MSTGTSCIVEQFGLAMMPSWGAASSGLTWLTDERDARRASARRDELSITVAPRATASGASASEADGAGREQRDVDPFERVRDGLADLVVRPATDDASRPAERPEASRRSSPSGKARSTQDLDHRPADDAGGADDGDGEGSSVHGRAGLRCDRHPFRARREYSSAPPVSRRRALVD